MNEVIPLSNDLSLLTKEINQYKEVAGNAVFEIGRRLKHIKERDLVHGEWSKWCESIELSPRYANKFIVVFDELYLKWSTSTTLGFEALYQIATMPPEERNKTHETQAGKQKTPSEMTVKELRELKRQLKEEQKARIDAENAARNYKTAAAAAQADAEQLRKQAEDKAEYPYWDGTVENISELEYDLLHDVAEARKCLPLFQKFNTYKRSLHRVDEEVLGQYEEFVSEVIDATKFLAYAPTTDGKTIIEAEVFK
ncbi:DUF3102 domain-containing protein [Listeria monocytogenes]